MRPQGGPARYTGPGHELSEMKVRGIVVFTLGLLVVAVGIHLAIAAMMGAFSDRARALEQSRPPRFADDRGQFPGVKLQEDPARDMAAYRDHERQALGRYEWVDRKAGVATIPIERAMDLVAEKGLPAPKQPKPVEVAPSGSF